MNHVYILGGLRSYIGVKDGMYRHIPRKSWGAEVLREVVSRFELPTDAIDYIIGGNAVGGGGNITRLAALSAGFPERIPAVTWICSAGRRWRRSARQQPRLRADGGSGHCRGNGEFFGTAVPHDVPEPSGI